MRYKRITSVNHSCCCWQKKSSAIQCYHFLRGDQYPDKTSSPFECNTKAWCVLLKHIKCQSLRRKKKYPGTNQLGQSRSWTLAFSPHNFLGFVFTQRHSLWMSSMLFDAVLQTWGIRFQNMNFSKNRFIPNTAISHYTVKESHCNDPAKWFGAFATRVTS